MRHRASAIDSSSYSKGTERDRPTSVFRHLNNRPTVLVANSDQFVQNNPHIVRHCY